MDKTILFAYALGKEARKLTNVPIEIICALSRASGAEFIASLTEETRSSKESLQEAIDLYILNVRRDVETMAKHQFAERNKA